jgi:hypothetical protein
MGAVASAVGDFASQAVESVFEPIKQVGQVAESVVREVGHAAESVGREVGKVGQAAVDDPVGTIAKVAAIATQQYWALPLISAATVMAHGGNLGQAALAAGVSYAAMGVADFVGSELSSAFANELTSSVGDAVLESTNTLADGTIEHVFSDGSTILQGVDGAVSTTPATLAPSWASQVAPEVLKGGINAVANASGSMAAKAISGGNLNDILMSGVTSGVGSAIGSTVAGGAKDLGLNNTAANIIGKAAGAATASTVAGKDAKLSFINALINTSLAEGGKQVSNGLKTAWKDVNESATKFNDQLKNATDNYNKTIAPLEQDAKAAQDAAAKSFDEYKPIRDKFSDLVKQYDAAKAAGDTTLANSLADQANALIPELNTATDKYNTDAATFDQKVAVFDTAGKEYQAEKDRLGESQKEYESRKANLEQTTKDFTETAVKVAGMSDSSKTAFGKLYTDGISLGDSYKTSETLNTLAEPAQSTFLRQYGKSNDLTSSLDFAQKINALDKNSLGGYSRAIDTGFSDEEALTLSPNLSNLRSDAQQIYLDGIKNGQDPGAAAMAATLYQMFGEEDTTPTKEYAPTSSTNTTGSVTVTDVGGGASTPLVPTGTEVGTIAGSTFVYNPATGKFDIPAEVETGGTEGATSLSPTESTATGVTPFTPEQKAAADELDAKLARNEITKEEYDARAKAIEAEEGLGTTGTGSGSSLISDALNTPNLADNTFTGTAPSGGKTGTAATSPIPTTTTATTAGTGPVTGGTTPSTGTTGTAPTAGASTTGTEGTGGGGTTAGTGAGTVGTGTGIGIGAGIGTIGSGYSGFQTAQSQDQFGGIKNLTPGLTERMDYTLSGLPVGSNNDTVNPMSDIKEMATGGSSSSTYDPYAIKDASGSGISGSLTPGLSKAQISYILSGLPGSNISVQGHAEGGEIEGHNPSFFSEGGLESIGNRYVEGEGDGTSDSVAAMLANGEFVIPADVVSKLGNGSNEAGAGVLDQFLAEIRKHANSNGEKLPPESKGPLGYLLDAKRKVKA